MPYEAPNPAKLRIKPVYGVDSYGHDLALPLLISQASNVATLTPSTASFHQTLHDSARPIDETLMFISESDKAELLHSGNDTNFDQSFILNPDMTAWSYKLALNMGFGLKVSAFTSGTINLGNIHLTITELGQGAGDTIIEDLTIDAGSSNLTGTGEQIVAFHADIIRPIKLNNAQPIKLRIQTEVEETGTNTWQVGMLPCYPLIPTAVPKQWLVSQLEAHLHASLDHAYAVFRDQNNQQLMDYSGCAENEAGRCS